MREIIARDARREFVGDGLNVAPGTLPAPGSALGSKGYLHLDAKNPENFVKLGKHGILRS